jgi:hypothetical protein
MSEVKRCGMLINSINVTLETLLQCYGRRTYALVNEVDRKVSVFTTKDMAGSLARLIKDANILYKQDSSKLVLIVLETEYGNDIKSKYINQYKNNGYTLYDGIKCNSYKLVPSVKFNRGSTCRYELYVVSNSNTRILIGIFNSYKDMSLFISECYPGNVVDTVIRHKSVLKL